MATDLQTILELEVPLIVTVGRRRVALDSVLGLGPGSIMELNKDADERLEVMINNKQIGNGEAIKVGENFGVRITDIKPPEERVEAMAG